MKIECTKEEFKILMDLVYAGNVVANGLKSKEERVGAYAEMEQKIFAMAKDFGLEEAIEYSDEFEEYMPTLGYEQEEEGINPLIDEYDEKVFWEELIVRFARRDALNEVGDVNPNMTNQEVSKKQVELEAFYEEEFGENGISYLKLQKPPIQQFKK
jgi:hypothetical protein